MRFASIFGRRDELIAADPDTYYLTDHYLDYPVVLVRLSRIHIDALRDLLGAAWRFVSAKTPTGKRPLRAQKEAPAPLRHRRQTRDVMPQGATTLPAAYYVDPAFFKREMDALFATMWVCAGRAEQIDRPGQFFVRELLGESIIITRAASGAVNAFYNVCRHRGTRLCAEPEGAFGGSIRCPYHAWTYDLDGRLIGAPHMEEVPHFRNDEYPLHRVHADVWDGHIFINLADRPAPLLQ